MNKQQQIWSAVIPVAPRTKKAHSQIIHSKGRHILLPSKQYKEFESECIKWLKSADLIPFCPIDHGVAMVMYIYNDTRRYGDIMGYYQAVADMLQTAGVIINDKYLIPIGNMECRFLDRENPRIEITLYKIKSVFEDS